LRVIFAIWLVRSNRRPRTMFSLWGTILIFLGLLKANGKTSREEVTWRDVEAFIEHEQDRGIKITTNVENNRQPALS
jgi:hypothetical protein